MSPLEKEALDLLRKIGKRAGFKRLFSYVCSRAREERDTAAWSDLEELLAIDLDSEWSSNGLTEGGLPSIAIKLAESGKALTCGLLVSEANCSRGHAYNVLAKLERAGKIRRVAQGRYRLAREAA